MQNNTCHLKHNAALTGLYNGKFVSNLQTSDSTANHFPLFPVVILPIMCPTEQC